ncbi:hypothetical protein BX616_001866 [Lobosporangium transversale]|nr:hypothetical protein BX616_001866 [Lobosporangium transversale]
MIFKSPILALTVIFLWKCPLYMPEHPFNGSDKDSESLKRKSSTISTPKPRTTAEIQDAARQRVDQEQLIASRDAVAPSPNIPPANPAEIYQRELRRLSKHSRSSVSQNGGAPSLVDPSTFCLSTMQTTPNTNAQSISGPSAKICFLDSDSDINIEATTNQHFSLAGIERFDNKTDASTWLRTMDAQYRISNVNDNFTVQVALHMDKVPRDWSLRHIDNLEAKNILTWKNFAQDFKAQFAKTLYYVLRLESHFNLAGIERFDSKADVSSWLRAMDALYKIPNVNDNFFTVRVALHMDKVARDWSLRYIDDLETKNILTWKNFAQDFKEQFAKADDEFELRYKYDNLSMKPNSDVMEFVREFEAAYYPLRDKIPEELPTSCRSMAPAQAL